jgi:hypothetical protein
MKTRKLKDDFYIKNYKTNEEKKVTRNEYVKEKLRLENSEKYEEVENVMEAMHEGYMNKFEIREELCVHEDTVDRVSWLNCKIYII